MMIILWEDENNKVEAEHINTVCDIASIELFIKTRNFSGRHTLFLPSIEIKKYIAALKDMYNDMDGRLDIHDNESDSEIRLCKDGDAWFISGQLGCSWERNMLIFNIPVDQTVIKILLTFFQNISISI